MELSKLRTQAEVRKKDRGKKMLLGIILVAIMVLSTAGYALYSGGSGNGNIIEYNGYKFVLTERGWFLQDFQILTQFLPYEVSNISDDITNFEDFSNKEIYFIALYSDEKIAASEIALNIPALRYQYACLENQSELTLCSEFPLKNCSNIPENQKIFIIEKIEESEGKIYEKEECIVIEGKSQENLIRTADKFIFDRYNIK